MAKQLARMHVSDATEKDIRKRIVRRRIQILKERAKDTEHNQHGRKEEKVQDMEERIGQKVQVMEERIGQKEGKAKEEERAKEEAGARARVCMRLISGGVREDPEDPEEPTGTVGLDTTAQ